MELRVGDESGSIGGSSTPSRMKARGREGLIVILLGMIGVGSILWWTLRSNAPARRTARVVVPKGSLGARYVGSRVCGECHPGETAAHSGSGHAQTFRPAGRQPLARWLNGRTVEDPERPEVTWTYALKDRQLSVVRAEGTRRDTQLVEFALVS
jgi:hypothetical protein